MEAEFYNNYFNKEDKNSLTTSVKIRLHLYFLNAVLGKSTRKISELYEGVISHTSVAVYINEGREIFENTGLISEMIANALLPEPKQAVTKENAGCQA